MAQACAQLNVRVDSEHKARAELLLKQAGYTPMRLIRLLWAGFSRSDATPEMVSDVIAAVSRDRTKASELDKKVRLVQKGASYMADSLAELGLSAAALPCDDDFESLRDEIADERFGECRL